MCSVSRTDGNFSDESFVSKDITWKVQNVFQLPKFVDFMLESPQFSFADGTWCLRMYPNGETEQQSQNHVDLMLVRLCSSVEKQKVFYKFCFKTRLGKEFESYSGSGDFIGCEDEWGVVEYLKSCQLHAKKQTIAPNDTVTVFCRVRCQKNATTEAGIQTDVATTIENVETELPVPRVVAKPSKLAQDFKKLLFDDEGSDVTIEVRGRKFSAHRAILRARSTVFASMFKSDMKEKATGVVNVEDCEPSTFSDFLHFLYCGSVEKLSPENVYSLYTTADKYDVQDLKCDCLDFMKTNLSVDTFCDTITLALKHCETELVELSTDFFAKNLQSIIVTVTWQTFIAENPTQGNELFVKALVSNKHTK